MRKFLICTPSYSQNNGGAIVLHKLCHLLNENGREAYLFPIVENFQLNRFNYRKVLLKFFKKNLREPFRRLKVNPAFKTPVLYQLPKDFKNRQDEWIVLYPEITFGNPLGAKNVVRWFLNNPEFDPETGGETRNVFFGKNELYFRYAPYFKDFRYPGSTTSDLFLRVTHLPLDLFNMENAAPVRKGIAYCIRKGKNKPICHDLQDSILIDGKKHQEIAAIFKRVETFISYDSHTAYSRFAALCGCDSVVIPDEGVTQEEWKPNIEDRYGVAYGFENVEWARSTRSQLRETVIGIESGSVANVLSFIQEVDGFFECANDSTLK